MPDFWQKPGRGQGESQWAQLESFKRKQIMKGSPQFASEKFSPEKEPEKVVNSEHVQKGL